MAKLAQLFCDLKQNGATMIDRFQEKTTMIDNSRVGNYINIAFDKLKPKLCII